MAEHTRSPLGKTPTSLTSSAEYRSHDTAPYEMAMFIAQKHSWVLELPHSSSLDWAPKGCLVERSIGMSYTVNPGEDRVAGCRAGLGPGVLGCAPPHLFACVDSLPADSSQTSHSPASTAQELELTLLVPRSILTMRPLPCRQHC